VEFGILGPLQVNGVDVTLPAKQRIVLAVLLLNANRVTPVDALTDALWDDAPPASARTTMQGYIKQLRQNVVLQVGERVVTRPPGYLIEARPGELDLDRFTGLRDRARDSSKAGDWESAATLYADALALWRGAPLGDIPSAMLRRTEVPRLAELRIAAIESRIGADLRLGRHHDLVAELRQLASGERLREELHGQLMLALYRCGRQAEALEVFRDVDRRLRDELRVSAGPELRELHQRILAADPELAIAGDTGPATVMASRRASPGTGPATRGKPVLVAPPAQLPADTVDFTGRDEQVKLLTDLLGAPPDKDRPGAVVVCAIAGMGGIGKSALAVHVAHRLRQRFPDGQLYVSLHGTAGPLQPSEVLSRLLRDLDDRDSAIPADPAEREARYRTLLAGQKVLVVLDDARDAAQVRPLLPGSAGCAVIVTSRNTLPGIPGATLLGLDVLDAAEAHAMFSAIVWSARAVAEPDPTSRVLASCAGLPLAIRIAGSWLASRPGSSVTRLATKLADERGRLAELTVGDLAIRASFAVSYDALPARHAWVFRLLGLPPGGLVLSTAAISVLAGEPALDVTAALNALLDANLVQSPEPDRFRLHDLLHGYAAELTERTDSPSIRRESVTRLLRWYAEQAYVTALALTPGRRLPLVVAISEAVQANRPGTEQAALSWYEAELANLTAAVGQAAALGLHEIAVQVAVAMFDFFQRTPYKDEWFAVTQTGVDSARHLPDDTALGRLLNPLGQIYTLREQPEDALECWAEALAVRRRHQDRHGEARVLNNIGLGLASRGQFAEALPYLRQCLEIFSSLDDQVHASHALNNIGLVLVSLKRHEEALECLAQALELQQAVADRFSQGATNNTIGDTYLDLGLFEEAARHYRTGRDINRVTAPDSLAHADSLYGLGSALRSVGLVAEAREAWLSALPILDRLGDPRTTQVRDHLTSTSHRGSGRAAPPPPGHQDR
jgi:DNA-binding SARP family transcriptional activator/tetratricopeptide (TPR) repeat protein